MAKTINWGIIGCGNVTEQKSGPAFGKIKGSKLIAVMRRDREKSMDYALRHKVPHFYDNAEQLIHNPEVNAIYVATPPGSHAGYAISAMKAGKAVYVEKPMAINHAQCLEMVKVSEETGTPLFVAYYRRRLPGFLKIKELIDSGVIGKPLFFSIRYFEPAKEADFRDPLPWRVIPEISGGGYLHDMGSHHLDLIDYLLGPIEKVSALTTSQKNLYEPEDFISAGFTGQEGIVGHGIWSFAAPDHAKEDYMEIIGEKGKVSFSCFSFSHTRLTVNGRSRYFVNKRPQHVQQGLIQTIVNELQGTGVCPSTGVTAARTSRVLDKITNTNSAGQ
ncbi:MAG: gfo/Idh/MocA family oxidoreductase [Bacteroidetes bacterium]|nr:MAG: gfo/Idh/MocA family oxidoreductase [Bacteroidota bacterium]